MGNLSEHFNQRDFSCRCGSCKFQTRIHLGLVGALEAIAENFKKTPIIHEGYRCEMASEKKSDMKKNSHRLGKAAHITILGLPVEELFKFARTLPEVNGLGINFNQGVVHIDTRELNKTGEREEWIKDGDKIIPLTNDLKAKYNLL